MGIKKKSIKYIVYISIVALAIYMTINVYGALSSHFYDTVYRNGMILESELTKVNDILEIEGKRANEVINNENLQEYFEKSKYSEILNYFQYDKERDFFHLDNIEEKYVGFNNITGKGNLDFLNNEEDLKTKEIYTAILLNDGLNVISDKVPSNTWAYYTSLNKFSIIKNNVLDFVPTSYFYFDEEMLKRQYITGGTKENHPNRESTFWSKPYVDLIDNVLIITSSYPIDYNGEYIGSISVDFRSYTLSYFLDKKYDTVLLNDSGTVLATNIEDVDFNSTLTHFDDLPLNMNFESLSEVGYEEAHSIKGSRVIAYKIEGTPYVIYQIYLLKDIIIDYIKYMMPIFIFLLIFIYTDHTSNIIKESEKKLKLTLSMLQAKQKELDYVANFDTLTDVYNRRGLFSQLETIREESDVSQSSLILLDIDHFKKINDTFGHHIGDEVLKELCKILKRCVTARDIVSRYGGEEFVIVLRDSNIKKAVELAENIRMTIDKHCFNEVEHITISIGISKINNDLLDGQCFKNADKALYKAKESGRNKVFYYDNSEIKPSNKIEEIKAEGEMFII